MSSEEADTAVTDTSPAPPPSRRESQDCLVVLAGVGQRLGTVLRLTKDQISVGRSSDNDFVLEDDRVSRQHAVLHRQDGRWAIADVGSRHGTWIDDARVDGYALLRNTARLQIGATIFKFLTGDDVESDVHEEIYRVSVTDGLTGLNNRRVLDEELEKEFIRARRHGRTFSVLLLDIDHFKLVNDKHGHGVGDLVLKQVAAAVRRSTRDGLDIVARYGGEELAVLAPETDLANAVALAERIRSTVEAIAVDDEGTQVKVTLSVGCAELSSVDTLPQSLFERADQKLYLAKNGGRNRVLG